MVLDNQEGHPLPLERIDMLNRIHMYIARRSDEGATAVEYALLIAAVAVAVIVAAAALGDQIAGTLRAMSDLIAAG
jgi:Flp pilus assembly pilin Flp